MKPIFLLFTLLALSLSFVATTSAKKLKANLEPQISGAINLGNSVITVSNKGTIGVYTPTGNMIVNTDSTRILENGPTDIYIAPELLNGAGTPMFGQNRPLSPFDPAYGIGQNQMFNRLSTYFSTASGGFGFRIVFDRRISKNLRAMVAPEFLTYSYLRSARILGDQMPSNTTRITLFSLPVGLQHQISRKGRVVPHIGFGVGPMIRFDHKAARPGYYPSSGGFGINGQFDRNVVGFDVPLFTEDYPEMSLTLGGHIAAGIGVKLGTKKDLGFSIESRYTLAKFIDNFGSPGDFSGFSFGIGFGKHF
jgi:hypothetical protein